MGIKITNNCILTHLLLFDDILIFINGSLGDITAFNSSFRSFFFSIGMECNHIKSTIYPTSFSPNEIHSALQHCPFTSLHFEESLKYLGFRLKPANYKIVDWVWLVAKIERRLNIWHHRWLSRAGRLIIIKSVLEATPVYWMSLAWIPKGIISKIQQLWYKFIWRGKHEGHIFSWASWDKIALPKKWGGWGMKNIEIFSSALAAKLGWNVLTSRNLWAEVVS